MLREWLPGVAMPFWRSAAYVLLFVMVTLMARPELLRFGRDAWFEAYTIVSMDLAISRAFCGTPSALSPLVSVTTVASTDPALRAVPMREIAASRSGSLDRFCETSTEPRVNNENSLMWLMSWMLRVTPNMSVDQMGTQLHAIHVALLAVALVLLVAGGTGVLVGAVSWWWMLELLDELRMYTYHGYPFLPVLLLVTAAGAATAIRLGWTRTLLGTVAVATVAGVWSSFGVNMRSSHLPVYVALTLTVFVLGAAQYGSGSWRSRLPALITALVLFVAAYAAFQYVAIDRYLPPGNQVLSRHTILHPLVISLGTPESELSRREGITWSDGVGLAKAMQVDPQVKYLESSYEHALLVYYTGLWRNHTREMAGVYWLKAGTAGKHMLMILRARTGRAGSLLSWLLAPLDWLPNGIYLATLYVTVALAGLWRARRRDTLVATLLALLAVVAVLLQAESAAIMSNYVINYHAYLAFFCVFLTVMAPATLAGIAWDTVAPRCDTASRFR